MTKYVITISADRTEQTLFPADHPQRETLLAAGDCFAVQFEADNWDDARGFFNRWLEDEWKRKPPPVELREWALVYASGDPFLAPELNRTCLSGVVTGHPRKTDGTRVRTTPVIGAYGRRVETQSGTVYELVGDPLPDFVEFLRDVGREFDPENPVKFQKRRGGVA